MISILATLLAAMIAVTTIDPEELVIPPKVHFLEFTFAGDLMCHTPNFRFGPFDRIYRPLAPYLQTDDLSFANLEFPVDDRFPYRNYPVFNSRSPYVTAAITGGFDVFSLANNHITDQGAQGVRQTAAALAGLADTAETNGRRVAWSGLRRDDGPVWEVTSLETGGLSIGFLAITMFVNLPDGIELVNFLDTRNETKRLAFIRYLASVTDDYDLFILSVHGGGEYSQAPSAQDRDFFRAAARAGVDVVWSHHPHVVQPWEWIELPGGRALILNSTGNFVSGQPWALGPSQFADTWAFTGDSALYRLRIRVSDGTPSLDGLRVIPIHQYTEPDGLVSVRTSDELRTSSEIPGPWRRFFSERFARVLPFLVGDHQRLFDP